MKIRTDDPKSAPFKVGQKLKYIGKHESYQIIKDKKIPWVTPGMVVEIVKNDYGHKGSGRQIDTDENGDPMYDETDDFVSVYQNEFGLRRLIHREDKKDWEVLK